MSKMDAIKSYQDYLVGKGSFVLRAPSDAGFPGAAFPGSAFPGAAAADSPHEKGFKTVSQNCTKNRRRGIRRGSGFHYADHERILAVRL